MEVPFGAIAGSLTNLANGFGSLTDSIGIQINSIISYIIDVRDNLNNGFNLLNNVIDNLRNSLHDIFSNLFSPLFYFIDNFQDNLQFVFSIILAPFLSFINGFNELVDRFRDYLHDFFIDLLVPKFSNFNYKYHILINYFNDKFPIINEIKIKIDEVTTELRLSNTDVPSFTFTLPQYTGDTSLKLIDFSLLTPYFPFIRGVILCIYYVFMIKKIYRFLPSVLGGIGSL